MKALTVMQPYAWAIMQQEGKTVENRPWRTLYRGRFCVHAGAQYWDADAGWIEFTFGLTVPPREELEFGAILGTVELVDVVRDADLWTEWALPGSYHWLLTDPKPFERPIRGVSGQQRFWEFEEGSEP
jgi:hypothetical protein